MSTLELHNVTSYGDSEPEAIAAYAAKWGVRRMYKLANDYGDRETHTNYYSVKDSNEEISLFKSPLVHNVVLVFDNGEHVNQPVTFNDTENGREVLGINFL